MIRVSKDKVCYSMSAENQAVAEVPQGEPFSVETEDCYSGNIKSPQDQFTKDMWDTVNPATGPIFISGAEPGDVLRVDIVEIKTRDYAVMCVEHGSGALGDFIEGVETRILPIENGRLVLSDALSVPVQPMIGVIGTAPVARQDDGGSHRNGRVGGQAGSRPGPGSPADTQPSGKAVLNGTPGEHGGNMDCKLIAPGSVVYLPVNAPGALLALGDLHALMGDGEVCICGAEVSGEVILKARSASPSVPTPCVETEDHLHLIGSAETLDECERLVLEKAHNFLTEVHGMRPNDAARAMSLLCDLGVCQVVDPLKTMRISIPKTLLTG